MTSLLPSSPGGSSYLSLLSGPSKTPGPVLANANVVLKRPRCALIGACAVIRVNMVYMFTQCPFSVVFYSASHRG